MILYLAWRIMIGKQREATLNMTVAGHAKFACSPYHGPFARYVKLCVAHAPWMPWTFPPPPRATDPDMHHGTCVTHVPWCMPGSLTSSFLWSRWRGRRSRHSRRMRNPQLHVSSKRPMALLSIKRECMLWCYQRPLLLRGSGTNTNISVIYMGQVPGLLSVLNRQQAGPGNL